MRIKKYTAAFLCLLLTVVFALSGCTGATEKATISDGVYQADFITDSSMFHVNETCDGKGTLTVKDGQMTIHITLGSKNIVNLYLGLAKDAQKEGAVLLQPTVDTVTYDDGLTEEVYGFDVPVEALDEDFDLAIIGTKGIWYDHKVSVSNPTPVEDTENDTGSVALEDGTYTVEATLTGGSGKAFIASPLTLLVSEGSMLARICWSSPNYDYMLVEGEKYLPVNAEGDSVFEIPVSVFDAPISVVADTVAMSKPHEIDYTITLHSDTLKADQKQEQDLSIAWSDLKCTGRMELSYANNFSVEEYGDYRLLTTMDDTKVLIVPKNSPVPKDVPEDVIVVKQPVEKLYLVASAAMDMFASLDAVDTISFSGQKEEGWYIQAAKEAMDSGELVYAGKYSSPDYELLVQQGCTLAIENRMITHSPQVVEMLEKFDIPVIIDDSSYEAHPLGRVEWVKFYGALLGKEKEAQAVFDEQEQILCKLSETENTGKTVAYFYITSNGLIQIRQSSDYIPKMLELSGGQYIFSDAVEEESARSTMTLQVEEFYDKAKSADYLIYNSSIDGGVSSLAQLLEKCAALADFKAVKEGNVWCTTNDMYQQSMSIGYMMQDFHGMLTGEEESQMHYLFHLE